MTPTQRDILTDLAAGRQPRRDRRLAPAIRALLASGLVTWTGRIPVPSQAGWAWLEAYADAYAARKAAEHARFLIMLRQGVDADSDKV